MRLARSLALAAIVIAVGCGDIKDMLALSAAVQERYHVPASINLNNDVHLTITFQNASAESLKLDSAGMDGFARGVAAFAKARYPKAARLEDVTVQFATVSTAGAITMTRTDAPYRYLASELP